MKEEEVLTRSLMEYKREELDKILMEAALALHQAVEGKLYVDRNGEHLEVIPNLSQWGEKIEAEDGTPVCEACLAGCWFVRRFGALLEDRREDLTTFDYYLGEDVEEVVEEITVSHLASSCNILEFLDGLRYPHRKLVQELLVLLGYRIPDYDPDYDWVDEDEPEEVLRALAALLTINGINQEEAT